MRYDTLFKYRARSSFSASMSQLIGNLWWRSWVHSSSTGPSLAWDIGRLFAFRCSVSCLWCPIWIFHKDEVDRCGVYLNWVILTTPCRFIDLPMHISGIEPYPSRLWDICLWDLAGFYPRMPSIWLPPYHSMTDTDRAWRYHGGCEPPRSIFSMEHGS